MATFFNSKTGRGIALAIGLLGVVALGPMAVFMLATLVVLACMIELISFVRVPSARVKPRGTDLAVATQTSIVIGGGLAAVLLIDSRGLWLTMVIIAAVFVENAAAQIFGKKFGRTRLAPRHSPNKTVEGALWGWLGGSLAGIVALALAWWLGGASDQIAADWREWLIIVIFTPPLAEIGDWLESRMKRFVGVKDSGDLTRISGSRFIRIVSLSSLFGRQGGALDKTDSLWICLIFATALLTAPAVTVATLIVATVAGGIAGFLWFLHSYD
ncbi:MAG: phosphatidate cytidylyltransferase [Sphaerimonospora mesophila]